MAFLPGWSDFNSYLKGNTDENSLFPTAPILKAGTGPSGAQTFGAPGGPAGAQTFGAAGAAPTSPPPVATAAPSTPTTPGPSAVGQGQGIDRYFSPIAQGVQKSQKSADDLYAQFSGQAGGMRREFGDPEKQELAEAYKTPNADNAAKAKSYVTAKYGGPAGLDQGAISGLTQGADELRDQARALRTTGGLQTTIQDTTPGLTAGASRFEARHLLKDPSLKARSREAEEGVNTFYSGLATGQEKAKEFAGARAAQEDELAKQSRGFLEGERAGITGEIDTRVAGEQSQRDAASRAYEDLLKYAAENESPADFAGYEGALKRADEFSDEDLTRLDSDQAKLTREAQAKYDEIMANPKYAAIADQPLLTRNITGRGKEYFSVVGPDGKKRDIRDVKGIPQATQKLLIERQREIEDNFRQQGGKKGDPESKKFKEGKYSDVMSLNIHGERPPVDEAGDPTKGGILTPPDPRLHKLASQDVRAFVSFDPGLSPSRANVSSEEEQKQFNAINGLLDEVERLSGSGETMRAAKIAADVEKYLDDEAGNLLALKEAGDKQAQRWDKSVKKARSKYKKMKESADWALATNVVLSVIFPVYGVYYGVGSAVQSAAGDETPFDPVGQTAGTLITGEAPQGGTTYGSAVTGGFTATGGKPKVPGNAAGLK